MNDGVTLSTSQLFAMFPDAESARRYFEGRLWPDGPRCPVCASGERITVRTGGFYRCNACHEDFTVRTGTIFERSHVPLHKWLAAMDLLVTAHTGLSSLHLSTQIGVTQKTAWFMLHRLRDARVGGRDAGALRATAPTVREAVADRVLAYRAKPKSESAKKRRRKHHRLTTDRPRGRSGGARVPVA